MCVLLLNYMLTSPCHAPQVMEVAWISIADICQDLSELGARAVEAKGDMSAVFPTRFAHLVPCAAAQPAIISDMLVQFSQVCEVDTISASAGMK